MIGRNPLPLVPDVTTKKTVKRFQFSLSRMLLSISGLVIWLAAIRRFSGEVFWLGDAAYGWYPHQYCKYVINVPLFAFLLWLSNKQHCRAIFSACLLGCIAGELSSVIAYAPPFAGWIGLPRFVEAGPTIPIPFGKLLLDEYGVKYAIGMIMGAGIASLLARARTLT